MSDEMDFIPMDDDDDELTDFTDDYEEEYSLVDSNQTHSVIQETLDYFLESASVDAVYGEPVEHGDTVIIPAAEVVSTMGFGLGSGYGSSKGKKEGDQDEEPGDNEASGSGGGGGGYNMARPVAVIIASPGGVRVEPVVDVTKIALAGLTAFGFMISMMARMRRPPRRLR